MAGEEEQEIISRNYQLFREHMSQILIQRVAEQTAREKKPSRSTGRRGQKSKSAGEELTPDQGDPEELAEFIDVSMSYLVDMPK